MLYVACCVLVDACWLLHSARCLLCVLSVAGCLLCFFLGGGRCLWLAVVGSLLCVGCGFLILAVSSALANGCCLLNVDLFVAVNCQSCVGHCTLCLSVTCLLFDDRCSLRVGCCLLCGFCCLVCDVCCV